MLVFSLSGKFSTRRECIRSLYSALELTTTTYLGAIGARTGGYLGAGKALRGYGKAARKKGGKIY